MIKTFQDIRDTRIVVGVPHGKDFLNMIALVQENGAHIKAKNYPFLWIPTSNAKGRKPSQIPNLYVRRRKGTDTAAAGVDDSSQPYGFRVYYVLKTSVDIPARPFLATTVQKNIRNWSILAGQKAYQAATGVIMLEDYYKILGQRIMHDLQDEMKQFMNPHNAPLTKERKGFDDPLMDTGTLIKSMTWFAVKVK